jgi:hypothetical protein
MPPGPRYTSETARKAGNNKQAIKVKDVEVAPRDVVAACLPDPCQSVVWLV